MDDGCWTIVFVLCPLYKPLTILHDTAPLDLAICPSFLKLRNLVAELNIERYCSITISDTAPPVHLFQIAGV